MDELLAVNLVEWGLLLGAMIGAVDTLVELLDDFPDTWPPFKAMLSSQTAYLISFHFLIDIFPEFVELRPGYVQLLAHLSKMFDAPSVTVSNAPKPAISEKSVRKGE